ncbi:hypothetical protein CRE_20049 [Caenorhabditis remanei]|uniref:Uncharacterized protein n=1 Tax=Caenorhabditis remanei TaxID=31234 RepID=E3NHH1_CAERE|nr:hypothetical protein CRE_20049 [Caenorhabditis remanei]
MVLETGQRHTSRQPCSL